MAWRDDIPFPLRTARMHEACGAGALGFAAMATAHSVTGQMAPVLWVREAWRAEMVNPHGLSAFFDPACLLLAQTKDQTETLAVGEEALKDGAVPLVVLEITQALNLREGRRLQLAAKAGGSTGLCLIPDGMGSNAAETRWRITPVFHEADSTLMIWENIKNKSGTLGSWHVRWNAKTRRVDLVSALRGGPGSAQAPG